MVEVTDEDAFARPMGNRSKLADALRDGFRSDQRFLEKTLGDAFVKIDFRPDLLQKQRKLIPSVLDALAQVGADFCGQCEVPKTKGAVSLLILRGIVGGPRLQVDPGGPMDSAPLDAVRRKSHKEYITTSPIELLAYYYAQPAPSDIALTDLIAFVNLQVLTSQFRRVWLFDFLRRKILHATPLN